MHHWLPVPSVIKLILQRFITRSPLQCPPGSGKASARELPLPLISPLLRDGKLWRGSVKMMSSYSKPIVAVGKKLSYAVTKLLCRDPKIPNKSLHANLPPSSLLWYWDGWSGYKSPSGQKARPPGINRLSRTYCARVKFHPEALRIENYCTRQVGAYPEWLRGLPRVGDSTRTPSR